MIIRTLAVAAASIVVATSSAFAGHHEKSEKMTEKANIVETAASVDRFSTLVAAVKAAGLVDTLSGEGPFTVFAPNNDAFAALPEGTVENLLKPENKDQLVAVLTYHVLSSKVKAKDVTGKELSVATVNGAEIAVDGSDGVKINNATVVNADIYTSNGVIHEIDTVLLPPASE